MAPQSMRRFWDARAAEDPFYFVDNRQRYRRPDEARFWAEGENDLDALLSAVEVRIAPTDEVVEIGCGIGRLTRVLSARARTVRALDVSPRMLAHARARGAELGNVEWLLGDGSSLQGVADESADVCISHVVFQHLPDPQLTLGYVREIGRVLRPGGWAAFQISNDRSVHRPPSARRRALVAVRGVIGRGPRGQADRSWLGSAVELDAVRDAAEDGGMVLERTAGEGTLMCCVLTRKQRGSRGRRAR